MYSLEEIQKVLKQIDFDGWLFYSFRNSDPFVKKILGLQETHITRRWFYFIPASGEPVKISHVIEQDKLDALQGNLKLYMTWQELHAALKETLKGFKKVAMQYSPMNEIPYISIVDAGTMELIRAFGVEPVSSALPIQIFESVLTAEQKEQHIYAAEKLRSFVDLVFKKAADSLNSNTPITDYQLSQYLMQLFEQSGMTTSSPPIVAFNANTANPHFEPTQENQTYLRKGDFILADMWAKKKEPFAVYADITWTAYAGDCVPERYTKIFNIVRDARDAAFNAADAAMRSGEQVLARDLDDIARGVITDAGYGKYFIHRTGHSIGEEVHGNGANLDNLETNDNRRLLPDTCCSIEPGIYLPGDFGIRSEIDLYLSNEGACKFGTPWQTEIIPIL